MPFAFGEVMYTLSGLIVARYNPTLNTYGTPVLVSGGQTLDIEPEADNDQLREYGQKVEGLAVIVGAKLKFSAGGYDYSAFSAITGFDEVITGTEGDYSRKLRVKAGGHGLLYFGAIGEGQTTDGSIALVGIPKGQLNTFPKASYNGQENKFSMSETEGYGYANPNQDVMILDTEQNPENWVRPTTGTEFGAFFA